LEIFDDLCNHVGCAKIRRYLRGFRLPVSKVRTDPILCHPRFDVALWRKKAAESSNVKHFHTLTILVLFTSLALGEDFKTTTGKEYKNASVSRVESDGIVLKSKSGIAKVYFTELPENVQERFHHDSAQGAHLTANEQAAVEQQNAGFAEDRLGGTAEQFAARYGPPQDSPALDKNFPLLEGAIHHTYEYQGWKIRVAFVESDGRALRMEYSKIIKTGVSSTIQDYELQAIMTANTLAGTTWKQIGYNPDSPNKGLSKVFESYFGDALGQKMWQRSDGAILWLRSTLTVRLELPAAHEYEAKLKAEKEQKARQSVPQF
jgi:hypothetical protein